MTTGKCWTQMRRADFDATAPQELPVQAGPARIAAVPDWFGTAALFGDTVPDRTPRRSGREQPGDVDGQEELF
ncbi:hypothetical protein GCM10022403_098970 [Streptomyces coacervatus]|uniref:Uncharacterized protein n=1 Tax=Streptomyces coacervatus TaxID=647381 RepID=A0ABP7JS98_9ACTN|nr:hypothetical protein [Streptomyces coacervatus]MDF2263865.1 hypothetical protein [Streptomyces coacervatus]